MTNSYARDSFAYGFDFTRPRSRYERVARLDVLANLLAHMNPPPAVPQITGADTSSEFSVTLGASFHRPFPSRPPGIVRTLSAGTRRPLVICCEVAFKAEPEIWFRRQKTVSIVFRAELSRVRRGRTSFAKTARVRQS